ncbi:site-specific recombinase XerD [Galbibacter orientalis DSM 19592]|uniref:Site-specific recombinase XerD n=1 Tax=Galbibacter orientalis DSM 19592 TaxID=926559 RepID=I3C284_9FLAO|nr:tyrosine-type recombinase/integrase [Galbibacter orientalis]EIJ37727.1 site-specific recombinase XerD [Galbibacter orientalis DSM 19592]
MIQKKVNQSIVDTVEKAAQYLMSDLGLSEPVTKTHRTIWELFLFFLREKKMDLSDTSGNSKFLDYLLENRPDLLRRGHSPLHSIKLLREYLRSGKILNTKEPWVFHGEIGTNMQEYIAEKIAEHLRESSIQTYRIQLSRFLRYLSKNEIRRVEEIRVEHILIYIKHLPPEHKSNIYIAISIVKRFLKWLFDQNRTTLNLSIQVPSGRYVQQSTLPAIYTREEIEKTLRSGVDRGYSTGKRDYLVLLLAAKLGLRSSDICNLRFENILWDRSVLLIEQVKTSRMLELPLLAEIGNAIIDYLKYGRPKSDEPFILLTANSPFRKMKSASIFSITSTSFRRAGVETANRKHGPHALRHSLAARMLEGQTSMPVISEVLGHGNTNSTMYYMRVDIRSLGVCVLDVPPIREGFYEQFNWKK